MAFKISLVSDVREFLRGTKDVEQALDEVAGSLDALAADTEADAKKASDALETKFTNAFKEVKAEAKTTGRAIGDDMHEGARRAGDGVRNLKDESRQTAREVAASFDGSAESVADGFQEVAANAFMGFGPAGAAAGLAAAAGMGLVGAAIRQAEEDTRKATEEVKEFRDQLEGVGNDVSKLDAGAAFKKWGEETTQVGDSVLPFLNEAMSNYDLLIRTGRALGVSNHTMYMAWTGDAKAVAEVQAANTAKQAELAVEQRKFADLNSGQVSPAIAAQRALLDDGTRALGYFIDKTGQASSLNQSYAETTRDASKATTELTEAQQEAKQVSADWAESLADHLSVADEGLDRFVKKGKLNLKEWAREVKERAKDVATIEDFKVDVFPTLSPEAEAEFAKLPAKTQSQIAEAYRDGSKKDRRKIKATLEAEVKVDSKVTETKLPPVTIPTEVDSSGAIVGAQTAADRAQSKANEDSNRIVFRTKIDHADLQRQVDRAAASIHPPTVTIKTRVSKEAP